MFKSIHMHLQKIQREREPCWDVRDLESYMRRNLVPVRVGSLSFPGTEYGV